MKCDVIILEIKNERAFPVLARHLAHDPNIPLSKAHSLLLDLPLIYMRHVSQEEALITQRHLKKIGVFVKIAQSSPNLNHNVAIKNTPIETSQTKEVPHAQPPPLPPQLPSTSPSPTLSSNPSKLTISAPVKDFKQIQKPHNRRKVVVLGLSAIIVFSFFLIVSKFIIPKLFGEIKPLAPTDSSTTITNASKTHQKNSPLKNNESSTQSPQSINPNNATNFDTTNQSSSTLEAIRFFRIAISINKHNIEAWHGLINAYSDAGDEEKSNETKIEMEKVLGTNSLSIVTYVKKFGTPKTATLKENGTYEISYETKTVGTEKLTQEAFTIIDGIRSVCTANAISLYAQSPNGAGILVYCTNKEASNGYSHFKSTATITILPPSAKNREDQ